MKTALWVLAAVACIALAVAGAAYLALREPAYGVELVYGVAFPADFAGDRAGTAEQVAQVIGRRLEKRGFRHARVERLDDARLRVLIPGARPEDVPTLRVLIGGRGAFELKQVIRSDATGVECESLPAPLQGIDRTSYPWVTDKIVVSRTSVITEADVAAAVAEGDIRRGARGGWKISWRLTPAGAARFDALAATLFGQNPRGMVAIVLDGVVLSAPVVQASRFGGLGEVAGTFDEREARSLTAMLLGGRLPVRVGNSRGEAGVPESERLYGAQPR